MHSLFDEVNAVNPQIAIKFNKNSNQNFQKQLQLNLAKYFKDNKIAKTADSAMWFRIFFFFLLYFVSWFFLSFSTHSLLMTTVFFTGLILAFKGIAYNTVHDASHRAITGHKKADSFLYNLSLTLLGPDPYLWKTRHNIDHHFYVNIPGLDSQLEGGSKVFRFTPDQQWKSFHRFQHIYASLVYSIVTLHWIFVRDFSDLFSQKFRNRHSNTQFCFHLIRMIFLKSAYLFFMIGIPSLNLDYSWISVLLGFVTFHLVLSWLVTVTFAVSHVNENLEFVDNNANGEIPHSFIEHQLKTSVDYHPSNKWVNFLFGGMSAHVAHHVFPHISSVHLPEVTKIIKRTCFEYGQPYHEASLFSLIKTHFKMLKSLGQKPMGKEAIKSAPYISSQLAKI
jgi:linoleoyl-CoA desaturase